MIDLAKYFRSPTRPEDCEPIEELKKARAQVEVRTKRLEELISQMKKAHEK